MQSHASPDSDIGSGARFAGRVGADAEARYGREVPDYGMKGVSEMKMRQHGKPVPDPDEIPEGIDLDDSERFLDDMIEDGRMMSE